MPSVSRSVSCKASQPSTDNASFARNFASAGGGSPRLRITTLIPLGTVASASAITP